MDIRPLDDNNIPEALEELLKMLENKTEEQKEKNIKND